MYCSSAFSSILTWFQCHMLCEWRVFKGYLVCYFAALTCEVLVSKQPWTSLTFQLVRRISMKIYKNTAKNNHRLMFYMKRAVIIVVIIAALSIGVYFVSCIFHLSRLWGMFFFHEKLRYLFAFSFFFFFLVLRPPICFHLYTH